MTGSPRDTKPCTGLPAGYAGARWTVRSRGDREEERSWNRSPAVCLKELTLGCAQCKNMELSALEHTGQGDEEQQESAQRLAGLHGHRHHSGCSAERLSLPTSTPGHKDDRKMA